MLDFQIVPADFFLLADAIAVILFSQVLRKFEIRRKFCLDAVKGFALLNVIPLFFE